MARYSRMTSGESGREVGKAQESKVQMHVGEKKLDSDYK